MVFKDLYGRIVRRWSGEGGYREVVVMAIPLILSTSTWSLQHFVDRMFLTWYSPDAIAAVMPSGIFNFATMSFFLGTAGYVSVFIAQYHGAGRERMVGPSLWQGIYIAVIGGVVHAAFIPLAGPFFAFVGHDPAVQQYEVIYYKILCAGAFPAIASSALSGFYTGLGRPWPVMWVNVIATTVNIVFDYLLIFGKAGFPEMGMAGAAIATVMAGFVYCIAYGVLIFRNAHNGRYAVLSGWRPDRALFSRLMRFGFPGGVQFFIDVAGFTTFILLVGRLGTESLAATNIAFNINTLAFMPMIGVGVAISVLVGQYQGRERPDIGERAVYSGFHLTFVYMAAISVLYVVWPGLFIRPFAARADAVSLAGVLPVVTVLLRFVAVYSLFDTMNIIFASALKGAGDTRFVMYMLVSVSLLVLVIPAYCVIVIFGGDVYASWYIASAYVVVLGFSFFLRFLAGRWRSMRVIEEPVACLPPTCPEIPGTEFELK